MNSKPHINLVKKASEKSTFPQRRHKDAAPVLADGARETQIEKELRVFETSWLSFKTLLKRCTLTVRYTAHTFMERPA